MRNLRRGVYLVYNILVPRDSIGLTILLASKARFPARIPTGLWNMFICPHVPCLGLIVNPAGVSGRLRVEATERLCWLHRWSKTKVQ